MYLAIAVALVLLIATHIQDVYELFTGETWEERVKRLNK